MAEAAKTDEGSKSPSKLRWIFGWLVIPGTIVAALFLAGVHVGATHPDMVLSRATLWMFDSEAQIGPTSAPEPLARRLRLLALPSKDYRLEAALSKDQLDEFVEAGAGPSIAELDCAKVCSLMWKAKHEDKEFISAQSCELERPTLFTGGKINCEAKVER